MSFDDDSDDGRSPSNPPRRSRIFYRPSRPSRSLERARFRDRFERTGKLLNLRELIGSLIRHHRVSDEVRQRSICLYWHEIVEPRVAAHAFPASFYQSTLNIAVDSSAWMHQLQTTKQHLIDAINGWVEKNRSWLGRPPLVTNIRFTNGSREREPLVDRKQLEELHASHLARTPRPAIDPPKSISAEDRAQILSDAASIDDPEIRATVEAVRLRWNR